MLCHFCGLIYAILKIRAEYCHRQTVIKYRFSREVLGMFKSLRSFAADESGATAIEYGLIAAGIAVAIIAVVNGLGSTLNTKFTTLNTSLK